VKTKIKIEASCLSEAKQVAATMQPPRNVTNWTIQVIGNIIEVVFDVASRVALVVYGSVKDSLPWHLQGRCIVSPV
jgi:hypothetical protein